MTYFWMAPESTTLARATSLTPNLSLEAWIAGWSRTPFPEILQNIVSTLGRGRHTEQIGWITGGLPKRMHVQYLGAVLRS